MFILNFDHKKFQFVHGICNGGQLNATYPSLDYDYNCYFWKIDVQIGRKNWFKGTADVKMLSDIVKQEPFHLVKLRLDGGDEEWEWGTVGCFNFFTQTLFLKSYNLKAEQFNGAQNIDIFQIL